MPIYVFDLNEGDSLDWEDEEHECESRAEIERHALLLIEEARTRLTVRGTENSPSTVVVYEPDGQIIMSAHGWTGGRVRVLWVEAQRGAAALTRPERTHGLGVLLDFADHLSVLPEDKA